MIGRLFRKQIFQNTLIFSGSSIINRAIPFLLAPIITRYLAPEDYGAVGLFISLLGVLIVFSGVNTNGIIAVKYFNVDHRHFKLLIGNIMMILVGSSLLLFLFMMLFSEWFSDYFDLPFEWIIIGLLCSIAMFITNVNLALWQLEKKAKNYAAYTIIETICNVGLSLLLIIVYQLTWEGRLLGIAASIILFGLISFFIIYIRGYMTLKFSKLLMTEALAFGLPMVPYNLSGWLRTGVNIVIITNVIGAGVAGMYNLGSQFALIVFFVGNGFTLALSPVIYEKLANINKEENLKLVRLNYIFFIGMIGLASVVSILAPYVIDTFFDERYHGSTPFIPWLSFAFAFFAMYLTVVNYVFHYKKTMVLSGLAVLSGLINLGLCYLLVDRVGAIGAAYASLASFCFMFVVVLLYTNRIHPLPWFQFKAILNLKQNQS